MNQICHEVSKQAQKDQLFYINYAGGDDLLIIGPWEWTIKLAIEIKKQFSQFVCGNQHLSLSGGIEVTHAKLPIRVSVFEAEEKLEHAKSVVYKEVAYKNSLSVLGETFSYETNQFTAGQYCIEDVLKDADQFTDWLQQKKISRGLLYNIRLISKLPKNVQLTYVPYLAYSIERNINDQELKQYLKNNLIVNEMKYSKLDYIKHPIMIALMKTRVKGE